MIRFLLCLNLLVSCFCFSQTIAEKKSGVFGRRGDLTPEMEKTLAEVNIDLKNWHDELNYLYKEVWTLYEQGAPERVYREYVEKIRTIKENIIGLETSWRELSQGKGNEPYGLWHQPETTLGQLIIDYGSQEFVYLMNAKISETKISVDSNIPIPRASWNEMIEEILRQNGFGIRQINPYLRQVFPIKDDLSTIVLITNQREELDLLPQNARICFVISPEPSDVRRIWFFLDKFTNPQTISLQMIGRDLLVTGTVGEVQEILKLYDFTTLNRGDKEYKAVPVNRIDALEMANILSAIFDQLGPETSQAKRQNKPIRPEDFERIRQNRPEASGEAFGLKVIALAKVAQAVFLVGTKEEIRKAEAIIKEVENQVGEASAKIIYTYHVKHSEAEELAGVLEKVYALMIKTGVGRERSERRAGDMARAQQQEENFFANEAAAELLRNQTPPPIGMYDEGYYLSDKFIVNPNPGEPRERRDRDVNANRNNFIVDPKTNSIVMVVEAATLNKLKELLQRLDVPKKMVQIEVLLFEKQLNKGNNYGLNLLRVGDCASNTHFTCYKWNDVSVDNANLGVFQFLLSRVQNGWMPAYDLAYKFLLTQDDIQINASPSVVAMNQTTAKIEIDEEISVSTGIFIIPIEGSNTTKDAFARARYGIKIAITPTIHMNEGDADGPFDDVPDYISLDTDILFETPRRDPLSPNRPPVTRRRITNQVRIQDGQTVILGGLRRKTTEDSCSQIPFLGEIPGFGKLFSATDLTEQSSEMFIFLTPRIISDPGEDMERIKRIEMTRRPGDIPEFLCCLVEAREWEKNRLFDHTLTMLFGPEPERCYSPYGEFLLPEEMSGEYDGR